MELAVPVLSELLFLSGTVLYFLAGDPSVTVRERLRRIASGARRTAACRKLISFRNRIADVGKTDAMETELAQILAYIHNMVILGRGERMSAELLLEELADVSRLLRPALIRMAGCLHVNDIEGASRVLYQEMGTSCAGEIGSFLARWEQIEPSELAGSVDAFRAALRENRETRLRRKDELISDLIYFPVVADCMLVLLNFIYVAYFIEQRQAMELLFYR